jgi:hypothetical protein
MAGEGRNNRNHSVATYFPDPAGKFIVLYET